MQGSWSEEHVFRIRNIQQLYTKSLKAYLFSVYELRSQKCALSANIFKCSSAAMWFTSVYIIQSLWTEDEPYMCIYFWCLFSSIAIITPHASLTSFQTGGFVARTSKTSARARLHNSLFFLPEPLSVSEPEIVIECKLVSIISGSELDTMGTKKT
jgi:hypothetical protein